jgi:hypothetical protein
VKQRVWLAKGYRSFQSAWRTLQSMETIHMIRKGRVRWLAKDDALWASTLHHRPVRHPGVADFTLQWILHAAVLPYSNFAMEPPVA